jgi:hypothetical protein
MMVLPPSAPVGDAGLRAAGTASRIIQGGVGEVGAVSP